MFEVEISRMERASMKAKDKIDKDPGSFFFFCLLKAAPVAYGVSQARGLTGVVASGLCHSHSNAGSEPHLRLTPQLTAMPDP